MYIFINSVFQERSFCCFNKRARVHGCNFRQRLFLISQRGYVLDFSYQCEDNVFILLNCIYIDNVHYVQAEQLLCSRNYKFVIFTQLLLNAVGFGENGLPAI